MQGLDHILHAIAVGLSQLLVPAMWGLQRIDAALRETLGTLHVPADWHEPMISAGWVIVLVVVVRFLRGWSRAVALLVIGLVLAKVRGILPPV